MKSINIMRALCLALLCVPFVAFNPGSNDCMDELKSIYKRMNSVSSENTAILLDYTVNTTLSEKAIEKGVKTAPANVKIVISKSYMRCISKEISYYQDAKNAFTVIPSRKLVYWSNSTEGLKKERSVQ